MRRVRAARIACAAAFLAAGGAALRGLPPAWAGPPRGVYDFAAACREEKVSSLLRRKRLNRVLRLAANKYARTETSSHYSDADAERLFAMLGEYSRFLRDTLAMDSFDNRGSPLHAFVNVRFHDAVPGQPQCVGNVFNAFWNDQANAAFIPAAALEYGEVVGHEFAHGVIGAGSGLIYQGQPGALHESLADAFGIAFRAWLENGAAGVPESLPADGWRMRFPGGVSRDLRAPGSLAVPDAGGRFPDHFDDFRHMPLKEDYGGVHINSSIVNQGFYLLAMGGRHPRRRSGPFVRGVGLRKAIGIFGLAASDLLTSNAGFEAARYAFALAAEIRHGKSSPEWVAVHTAMDAVGVPGHWTRPAPPLQSEPPPIPAAPPAPTTTPPAPPPTTGPPPAPAPPTSAGGNATTWAIVWAAAALALAFLGYVLIRFRSDRVAPAPAEAPPAAPAPRTAGILAPTDGSAPIPLRRDWLTSAEGLVIGRSAELCHAQIRDPQVSRRHLRLRLAGRALQVEDLNSTRGTQVDAAPAPPFQPVLLRSGRTLRIAALSYRFDSSPAGPRRPREDDARK